MIPHWLKVFEVVMIILAIGAIIWFVFSGAVILGGPFFLIIYIWIIRSLVIGTWFYLDSRKTLKKSVLSAVADMMSVQRVPFWRDGYFYERDAVLRNKQADK